VIHLSPHTTDSTSVPRGRRTDEKKKKRGKKKKTPKKKREEKEWTSPSLLTWQLSGKQTGRRANRESSKATAMTDNTHPCHE
jgi:hypothetical protein